MTWAPAYATADELASQLSVPNNDTELASAVEAASRAIDRATNRQFGLTDTESRIYEPKRYRDLWYIEVDDLAGAPTAVETIGDDGTVIGTLTRFKLTPRNATATGRPYTGIDFAHGSAVNWHDIRVTAQFGWPAVPEPIKLATRIQAGKFYSRRNEAGVLTKEVVDDVERGWVAAVSQDLDADVMAMIAPFRRIVVAA
ncbi:hypothetical protein QN239_26790 [Mycolicibacterium sp. Y3]